VEKVEADAGEEGVEHAAAAAGCVDPSSPGIERAIAARRHHQQHQPAAEQRREQWAAQAEGDQGE